MNGSGLKLNLVKLRPDKVRPDKHTVGFPAWNLIPQYDTSSSSVDILSPPDSALSTVHSFIVKHFHVVPPSVNCLFPSIITTIILTYDKHF